MSESNRGIEEGEVFWQDLRAHADREALFLIGGEVALLEVARAVATDDTAAVDAWIREGVIVRPTAEQMSAWNKTPDKSFTATVVQPFALAKER